MENNIPGVGRICRYINRYFSLSLTSERTN